MLLKICVDDEDIPLFKGNVTNSRENFLIHGVMYDCKQYAKMEITEINKLMIKKIQENPCFKEAAIGTFVAVLKSRLVLDDLWDNEENEEENAIASSSSDNAKRKRNRSSSSEKEIKKTKLSTAQIEVANSAIISNTVDQNESENEDNEDQNLTDNLMNDYLSFPTNTGRKKVGIVKLVRVEGQKCYIKLLERCVKRDLQVKKEIKELNKFAAKTTLSQLVNTEFFIPREYFETQQQETLKKLTEQIEINFEQQSQPKPPSKYEEWEALYPGRVFQGSRNPLLNEKKNIWEKEASDILLKNKARVDALKKKYGYEKLLATNWSSMQVILNNSLSKDFDTEADKEIVEDKLKKILRSRMKGTKAYHNTKLSNKSNRIEYLDREKGRFIRKKSTQDNTLSKPN